MRERGTGHGVGSKAKRVRGRPDKGPAGVVKLHADFLSLYPFREHPEEIEATLTPEQIYNPGPGQSYFLGWVEFKLKRLGRVFPGSALYAQSAREHHGRLKELLKVAVDSSLTVAEKIDAHWEDIKGFGGDKPVAKKIIFCYSPEKMLPIFKTEHLEYFARQLEVNYTREAYDPYGKAYGALSTGQRCELLNRALLEAFGYQDKELNVYDALLLARFLYETFPPQKRPPRREDRRQRTEEIEPLHSLGILFRPECEQEVVYLFSVLHRELGFPYVLKIRSEFPDAVVIDGKRESKTVEFELRASDFLQHGHQKDGCDFIVCWENDLEEVDEEIRRSFP